jgi:hypothetical protein
MGVSTTEMNSNMWSVLTNSKSADFIVSMLHQMFTTGHTKYGQYSQPVDFLGMFFPIFRVTKQTIPNTD